MCKLLNVTNRRMASVFYKTPDCSNVPDDSATRKFNPISFTWESRLE